MADVVQNVIFRIGSKVMAGGGFASLQSAIQMAGQLTSKVTEAIKEFEKFDQVYK